MRRNTLLLALIGLTCSLNLWAKDDSTPTNRFYSNRPANTWEEYLVSGNGEQGLMDYTLLYIGILPYTQNAFPSEQSHSGRHFCIFKPGFRRMPSYFHQMPSYFREMPSQKI